LTKEVNGKHKFLKWRCTKKSIQIINPVYFSSIFTQVTNECTICHNYVLLCRHDLVYLNKEKLETSWRKIWGEHCLWKAVGRASLIEILTKNK
jgi:hypothetical protein